MVGPAPRDHAAWWRTPAQRAPAPPARKEQPWPPTSSASPLRWWWRTTRCGRSPRATGTAPHPRSGTRRRWASPPSASRCWSSACSRRLLAASGEPVVLGGARLRRDRPAAGRHVGAAPRQRLRRADVASFGGFWISYWLIEQFFSPTSAGERGSAMGLFFIAWAIFTALLWVASLRTTAVVSVMLLALTVAFLLVGIGDAGRARRAGEDRRLVRARRRRRGALRRLRRRDQRHLGAHRAAARAAAAGGGMTRRHPQDQPIAGSRPRSVTANLDDRGRMADSPSGTSPPAERCGRRPRPTAPARRPPRHDGPGDRPPCPGRAR